MPSRTMTEQKGFLATTHYELVDEKPIIHLYGRLETGESFEAVVETRPYFFIKQQDELAAKQLLHINTTATQLQTLDHEAVIRIDLVNPKQVPEMRKLFEEHDIPCFEADIRFTQRYLIDKDIRSCLKIHGEATPGRYTDLFFDHPKIKPLETTTAQPCVLSFDIETDKNAKKIYSISLYNKDVSEVLVVGNDAIYELHKKRKLKNTTVLSDEKALLTRFFSRLKEIDADILTGWNVIDFDLQIIAKRAKHYDIPFVLGRHPSSSNLRLESSFFRDSHVNSRGRIVLDGIHLLKASFVKLDNYKLNTAAKYFLKDSKLIEEDNRFDIIDKAYTQDPLHFIDYNLKDSRLVYDILDVSGVLDLTRQRSLLTGLHMDNVQASIASFDSLYLRKLRKAGFVANTTRPQERDMGMGGFVMSSKPGIYTNILVLDFKSLYPSLMRTFNIDPVSFQGMKEEMEKKKSIDAKKHIVAPNGAVFANEQGILSQLLETLWKARDEERKKGNELARYAIKIQMNSMYGVLASPNSRFHNRAVSNAITSFGQHFIKETAKKIEEQGYDVIYGDTDSVFVDPKTESIDDAQVIGKQLEKDLNEYLRKHIMQKYKRESILELEFEKLFTRFFMPRVRGSDVGAKKRYAGRKLVGKDHETVLDFTGLEFVRRDWTEVSKEFQLKLLDLVFAGKDVSHFIKQFVEDLRSGKYDKLLIYRKALRKDVDSYTKTTPPHVKAARLLDKISSTIIEYVITVDGPQPIEKQTSPLDYDHYIDKQIRPIANSVLELANSSFDDVIKGSEQKGLGDFM